VTPPHNAEDLDARPSCRVRRWLPNKRLLLSRFEGVVEGALALRLAPNGNQVAAQQNREAVRLHKWLKGGGSGLVDHGERMEAASNCGDPAGARACGAMEGCPTPLWFGIPARRVARS